MKINYECQECGHIINSNTYVANPSVKEGHMVESKGAKCCGRAMKKTEGWK